MTIAEQINTRQIREVLHFTTSHGCLGTLYTKLLQSRERLEGDELVEYLFKPNSKFRKDIDYLDYVSLSISHINAEFYQTCSQSWHRAEPIFWCILAFDPIILAHAGVQFATTNNIYTSVVRGTGGEGLAGLYANTVTLWTGNIARRTSRLSSCHPTCNQAEVLYPASVSTDYLKRIYVKSVGDQSEVIGFLKACLHRDVEVLVAPQKFGYRVP